MKGEIEGVVKELLKKVESADSGADAQEYTAAVFNLIQGLVVLKQMDDPF